MASGIPTAATPHRPLPPPPSTAATFEGTPCIAARVASAVMQAQSQASCTSLGQVITAGSSRHVHETSPRQPPAPGTRGSQASSRLSLGGKQLGGRQQGIGGTRQRDDPFAGQQVFTVGWLG